MRGHLGARPRLLPHGIRRRLVPDGHRDGWPAPFDNDPKARAGLAYQLAEGIGLLSKVDWKAQGLEGLGRPDGFHDRQVDRWTRFFERIKAREIEGMDIATKWLQNHRPLDYIPGLMHGDYQFANVMYEHGGPAKLAALVDWEMALSAIRSSTSAGCS